MYSFRSKVRYSEVNKDGKLDIPSIINYFQDCSTFQSESLGLGVEHLKKEKRAWLLNVWQVEFIKDAYLMEDIEIGTWSWGAKGIYGHRNFVLNDAKGNRLVNGNSLWVFTDITTGKPVIVEPKDIEPYGIEPPIDMTDYGRKIKIEGDGEQYTSFKVRKYHIDTNGHVNNAVYVQFATEYLNDDIRVKVLRVEYRKPAVYGDVIYPVIYRDGSSLTVLLNDEKGSGYAKVQFIY